MSVLIKFELYVGKPDGAIKWIKQSSYINIYHVSSHFSHKIAVCNKETLLLGLKNFCSPMNSWSLKWSQAKQMANLLHKLPAGMCLFLLTPAISSVCSLVYYNFTIIRSPTLVCIIILSRQKVMSTHNVTGTARLIFLFLFLA